jgi:thymidylate synthase (FAD)
MTKQSEILNDPNAIAVLDHGFVRVVDSMGSDAAIVQAARVSYGDGTKTVMEDRGLIRYLIKHKHTSPIEQCVVKLHIKMPVFIARQWIRHRTASLNEYSGRYSVMTDEFYLPEPEVIQPQSSDNKQGRFGSLSETSTTGVRWMMQAAYNQSYDIYQALLGETDPSKFQDGQIIYDPYDEEDPLFGEDFGGIAREMARCVLPVANYTELYWTQNLHNMMHLLKLRMDPHAQYEIRMFANAVYDLIQPLFPEALKAFEDYVREAKTLSRMEINIVRDLFAQLPAGSFANMVVVAGGEKAFAEKYGLSLREFREFTKEWEFSLEAPKISYETPEFMATIPTPQPTPKPRRAAAKKAPAKKAPARKVEPFKEGKVRKGGLNPVRDDMPRPPSPAPMKAKEAGGPEFAADGSPMGWVNNQWIPVGLPPKTWGVTKSKNPTKSPPRAPKPTKLSD